MQKIFIILFISFILLTNGCSINNNEGFQAKKNCSMYIKNAESRLALPYYGTYYSKKFETCISIYHSDNLFDQIGNWRFYHNELTGSRPQDFTEISPKDYEWFDGVPVIMKDDSKYEEYEKFLQLQK